MAQSRLGRWWSVSESASVAAWAVAALGLALPAPGAELYRSENTSVTLDTTFSVGASVRVSDRDSNLIYIGNGGTNPDPTYVNSDDGNLNYDRGDFFSVNGKITSDLEAEWRRPGDVLSNLGVFVRTTAFYDIIQNCKTCTQRSDLDSQARHRKSVMDGGVVGTQFLLLDAYLDARLDVADHLVSIRFGNQVLSWGENVFYQGGINAINAIDVARIRTPGSELKEALVPAPMIRVSADLFGGLSAEAYYQFNWNRTNVDPVGSYWATSDVVGRAAEGLFFGQAALAPGRPVVGDPNSNPWIPGICGGAGNPPFPDCTSRRLFGVSGGVPRIGDAKPPRQGQYGFALRYFLDLEPLPYTEFGLYYVHYHSKTPTVGMDGMVLPPIPGLTSVFAFLPSSYFRDYAEHINLVGFSFNTEVLNAAISGEISYRPDNPIPVNPQSAAIIAGAGMILTPIRQGGFVTEEKIQASVNVIQTFGPGTRWGIGRLVELLHVDDMSLTTEFAVVNYPNLPDACDRRKNPLLPNPEFEAAVANGGGCVPIQGPPGRKVDATSFGYQMIFLMNYTDPLGIPITLTPSIAWQHDVIGNTPGLDPFIEERKAVTLGLELDYLETWGAKITYANFFGAGESNLIQDRDFFGFSASYAF